MEKRIPLPQTAKVRILTMQSEMNTYIKGVADGLGLEQCRLDGQTLEFIVDEEEKKDG